MVGMLIVKRASSVFKLRMCNRAAVTVKILMAIVERVKRAMVRREGLLLTRYARDRKPANEKAPRLRVGLFPGRELGEAPFGP